MPDPYSLPRWLRSFCARWFPWLFGRGRAPSAAVRCSPEVLACESREAAGSLVSVGAGALGLALIDPLGGGDDARPELRGDASQVEVINAGPGHDGVPAATDLSSATAAVYVAQRSAAEELTAGLPTPQASTSWANDPFQAPEDPFQ